jgi:hypothetical protein
MGGRATQRIRALGTERPQAIAQIKKPHTCVGGFFVY